MPNTDWSKLNSLQLGRYGEYYAKMEFVSYGFEVYTSEIDDHGIDFITKKPNGRLLEIQVKSVRKNNYVFIKKDKWDIKNKCLYLALLLFENGRLPNLYIIPAIAWQQPNELLCDKNYEGLKSAPEYGVNLSKKNKAILDLYKLEIFENIIT